MKSNVTSPDRIIRLILAVVLAIVYFTHVVPATLGIILLVAAIILAITAIVGFCPLYCITGSCPLNKRK